MFTLPLPILGVKLLVLVKNFDDTILYFIRQLVDIALPVVSAGPLHPRTPLNDLITSETYLFATVRLTG